MACSPHLLTFFSRIRVAWIAPQSMRRPQDLASGYVKIAIENCTFIDDLPIENGDFP